MVIRAEVRRPPTISTQSIREITAMQIFLGFLARGWKISSCIDCSNPYESRITPGGSGG